MGPVETGVRASLRAYGVETPRTALEVLAVTLAGVLDREPAEATVAALSRELRLTLAQVADQPSPEDDPVAELAARRGAR